MIRYVSIGTIVVGMILFSHSSGFAEDVRWTGPADLSSPSSFFDRSNWQGGEVPSGEEDDAFLGWDPAHSPSTPAVIYFGDFNPGGGGAVVPAGNAEFKTMFIDNGDFVFDFGTHGAPGGSPGTLTLDDYGRSDYVSGNPRSLRGALLIGSDSSAANPGVASLKVVGGGLSTRTLYVGDVNGGSVGHLTLSGEGTSVQVGGPEKADRVTDVAIGYGSTLRVLDGAELRVTRDLATIESELTIDGSGTTVEIGTSSRFLAESAVVVSGGATVSVLGNLIPGDNGSPGLTTMFNESSVAITGEGSSWTSYAQFQVGSQNLSDDPGAASLVISEGGELVSGKAVSPTGTSGIIGQDASGRGVATVTGAGSSWTQDGALNVGFEGHGVLKVEDGGMTRSVDGIIGRSAGSIGDVTVTGADSLWRVDEALTIGGTQEAAGGLGSLTVADGGLVMVGETLKLWDDGIINLSGGTVLVGDPQSSDISLGAIQVGLGGTLAGTGIINGDVLLDGGTLSPGHSPGLLTIDGDLIQGSDGLIDMEIGGLLAGSQYDQLFVTGDGIFDGLLRISFIDGFAPSTGDSFDLIMVAGFTTGEFSSIEFLGGGSDYRFTTDFTDGTFRLNIATVPEPASWAMLAMSLGGLAVIVARRGNVRTV